MASMGDALPRLFIDSSILMAGSLSATGFARDLLLMGARGEVTLIVSPFVLQETERNLYKKAPDGLAAFWGLRKPFAVRKDDDILTRRGKCTTQHHFASCGLSGSVPSRNFKPPLIAR